MTRRMDYVACAEPSPALFGVLCDRYGIDCAGDATDLGGSSNLNLLVCAGNGRYVVRVYRPYVTPARLADIQLVRRELTVGGVPCSTMVATRDGEPWAVTDDRLVEVDCKSDDGIRRLRWLVDAYDRGLDDPLTHAERAALPLAMARQPLWAVGRWLALLDDERRARRLAAEMRRDVDWALRFVRDLGRWQSGFA